MENLYLDEGEFCEDEKTTTCNPENSVEMEENNQSGYCLSELKAQFQKIDSKVPSMVDVKHENTSERCHQDSCLCGNELTFPSYTSFVSHTNSFSRHSIGSSGRISDPLCTFHRAASLFNIPVNSKSSGFSCKIQNNQRRRRSTNNVDDFIYECSSTAATGDVIRSPSARWIFDSIEGNVKARSLLECSLLFHLDVLDDKMRQDRSRSPSTILTKSSELTLSPALWKTSRDGISESNLSERKLVSCTSTTSTCSYQATSSANFSISKGLLYCAWKNGLPYFVFSSEDGGQVYVANPLKVESSVDKALDYMYVFHSRTNGKRDSRKHRTNTSSIVGRMKVSSSLVLSSDRTSLMETEFVLFGCHGDHSKEMQGSSYTLTKSMGLSKKVSGIFRPSHNLKHHSIHEVRDEFMRALVVELGDLNEMNPVDHLEKDFPPNLELAAIVVKDYKHNSNKEASLGGWGIKFLDKGLVADSDTSQETTHSCKICEESCDCEPSTRRMDVIVPADLHGGPIQIEGGPSRLIERWRSGGQCDCGGWDLGCRLTILKSSYNCSKHSPEEDLENYSLSEEGKELGGPALRIVNKSEGMHLVYFQSTLSALQSFSIAVAAIHSRSPDLSPKL
ncbi:uncharacterized protein M6B38_337925 [Iris pallida]|uniref:Uncharacterized protein n=1 Tax=Iris pallida TaxID=29817 RepID=A0AAX6GZ90_IRIPA|nr:uncharacterized protein M6B38_337925 [Iris pallida]